jgi:heme O synthase-like polyprenyltransferase
MKRSKRQGSRYLAGLVIAFAILFFIVGTLGPAHHSPYYLAIVPLPSAIALFLGWRAWSSQNERSTGYSAAALVLLLLVLVFSHLLPRSTG